MSEGNPHAPWLRPLIVFGTIVLSWAALLIGQQFTTVTVEVGEPSPETFIATREFSIEDGSETQRLRDEAEAAVPRIFKQDPEVDTVVLEQIQSLFVSVREGTRLADARTLPEVTTTTIATTTSTQAEETTTSTEAPTETTGDASTTTTVAATTTTTTVTETVPRTAGVLGRLFVDADEDGLFTDADFGLEGVRLKVFDSMGEESLAITDSDGEYSVTRLAAGEAVVLVETGTVHERLTADTDLLLRRVELFEDVDTPLEDLAFTIMVVPVETQRLTLDNSALLSPGAIDVLVQIATEDVTRDIRGLEPWLTSVEAAVARRALEALEGGIESDQLQDVKRDVRQSSSFDFALPGAPADLVIATSRVVTETAAEFLLPNKEIDDVAFQRARSAARAGVQPFLITYEPGNTIVNQGVEVTPLLELALQEAGLLTQAAPRYAALAAVVTLVVLLMAFYLGRFRPIVWGSMRRVALFGMLTVLAALSARLIAVFATETPAAGYLIPAASFGLMAAILFDARIAVLMSMVVGSMTAIATLDPGYTLFATLATLTPVPFVSSISARRELRLAVVYMIVLLALLAGGVAWFFQDGATARDAALNGALNGFLSGLVGSALLSFFEIMFDVTTSLRLLDLTDRNHPGLRLLEEKAIGTFNHSLMVGTLADRAARAVDANALLARAAAYYHDLGKTENPQFFIENQFGIQNPHDRMPPEESANVIRQHVIDGRRLARQFRIPQDVANGVITHHGDGIMHYFYGKAIERYGEERVDIEDYRHVGRKPISKEMAIVMMADSVEGACRAIFQVQEPSPERISEVVERIVGEKVADGQLSECSLTLGDLTRAKSAMVDALIGYYHQRIPYPNFPTGEIEPGADGEEDGSPRLPAETPTDSPAEAPGRATTE